MHAVDASPLGAEELAHIDGYWPAANYLSVGQIYLMSNPLLRDPLLPKQVKPRLPGHWGTTPGLNLLIDRVPGLARRAAVLRQQMVDKRAEHHAHTRRTGEDLPEVRDWVRPSG
jgi:phosphoketolase